MSLHDSVRAGLAELEPLDARDQPVADLALLYAQAVDDSADWQDRQRDPLAELGPKLLAALAALQMTPAARKAAVSGGEVAAARSPLDELRAKRAARSSC